jgi:nucleoside-diphosphate-sugar epimerase
MDLNGKTMAITGVGGFIGLRMTELAIERGMTVRGLDLSPEAAARAAALGAEVIVADVCDADAARRVCADADVVFHTAALLDEDGPMALFRRVNVGGTETMAAAASQAGAARFVHLSSVMVYGFDFPDGINEDGPFDGAGNPYCRTKIESESAALGFHTPGQLEVIIIRPGDVYGAGSIPWVVRPMEMMQAGYFRLIDGGSGIINHVYVDNVLDAVFLALEKDATGQAFNVTDGCKTTFAEFFGRVAKLADVAKLGSLPAWLMLPVSTVVSGAFKLFRAKPPFAPAAIRFVQRSGGYSIERARRVLGYEPVVTLDEGMARIADALSSKDSH